MNIHHIPDNRQLPKSGGVREHCRQLINQLWAHPDTELWMDYVNADVVHVQSCYRPPPTGRIDVYTCHGGFIPPILQVKQNLYNASIIISVAQWIVDRYFSARQKQKTIVIPNGINLEAWENLPPNHLGLEPGYFLWGKEFMRPDWSHFSWLAQELPRRRFVSTLAPPKGTCMIPENVQVIGLQSQEQMRSIINDCVAYVSTGSEVCPTMVLEAWACKRPVLAWNNHGNYETLTNSGPEMGGKLYRSLKHMVDCALGLLSDGPAHGRDGYEVVRSYYQWSDIAQRTIDVYNEVVNK